LPGGVPDRGVGGAAGAALRLFPQVLQRLDGQRLGRGDALRLEFFGAERGMYGTDFPMGSKNGEDWPVEVLDTIRSLGLSAADQELLLGANLHRIMRL